MWLPIVAAATGMVGAILADIISSRLGTGSVAGYAISLLCGAVVTIAALLLSGLGTRAGVDQLGFGMLAFLLYGAWWFIFFLNFVQSFESSLRVRILTVLRDAGGRLPRAVLFRIYNDHSLLGLRLERLLEKGYVLERNGRLFVVSVQLKLAALFFRSLKMGLLGRRSEFDRPVSGSDPSSISSQDKI